MKGLLKAESAKFKQSISLWCVLAVLLVSACISIFAGIYSSAENAFLNMSKDSMVIILACAVYSGLSLTEDFSSGMIKHYAASGHKRSSIVIVKFMHYIFCCILLIVLYLLLSVLIAVAYLGTENSIGDLLSAVSLTIIKSIPLYLGIFSLFFFIAILVNKGAVSMGLSVAGAIMAVVFTNKFYFSSPSPQMSLLRFSPVIVLQELTKSTLNMVDYWLSASLSIAFIGLALITWTASPTASPTRKRYSKR